VVTSVLAVLQVHITVVFGFKAVLHQLKLLLPDYSRQPGATDFGFEDLDRAFFAQLTQAGLHDWYEADSSR
jgi:hypothetical protein